MLKNILTNRLSPALVPPNGDPERILRDQDLLIRTVYNVENTGRAGSIEQDPIHALDQAFY